MATRPEGPWGDRKFDCDGPTQRKVLERIHRVMKPGSLLYVGHSENFSEARDLFHLRGKTIYERV